MLVYRQPLLGRYVTKTSQKIGYKQEKDQGLGPWMGHVTLARPQAFFLTSIYLSEMIIIIASPLLPGLEERQII